MTIVENTTERERYQAFLAERTTLTLGVLDTDGGAMLSVVPFVAVDGALYVYVSSIADHYDLLAASTEATVLFRADEAASPNLFAMERARFRCSVTAVAEAEHEHVFERFAEATNAALVRMLRGLDFHLFRLDPTAGRYVVGFGKAYDVDFSGDRFDHVVIDKK